MGFAEFWTLIPPAIGIGGDCWIMRAHIKGVVECVDGDGYGDDNRDFAVNVYFGKRLDIGYGISIFPLLQLGRRTYGAFSSIAGAIKLYQN